MAKISELPPLANPTGDEPVPVVSGGKTWRASLKALAAAAVEPVRAAMARDLARVEAAGAILDPREYELSGMLSASATTDGYLLTGQPQPGLPPRRSAPLGSTAPLPIFIGIGNSLIENGVARATAKVFTRRTGILVQDANLGRSGTTEYAIRVNAGATVVRYQPITGFIPAATDAVALTPSDPGPLQAFGGAAGATEGYLAGVRGTFRWAAGGPMSFERQVPGPAVGVPEPVPYQPIFYDRDARDAYSKGLAAQRWVVNRPFDGFLILWGLANDIFDLPTPTALAEAAVAHYERLLALHGFADAFVILSELNTRTAVKGSRAYAQVNAINDALRRRWPNNFVDVRAALNALGTADDKVADIPPANLLYDQYLHPNETGRAICAEAVVDVIIANRLFEDVAMPIAPPRPAMAASLMAAPGQVVAGPTSPTPEPPAVTLRLAQADTDNAMRFDPVTGTYRLPETGTYQVSGSIRLASGTAAGISVGLGIGIRDQAALTTWAQTHGVRQSMAVSRVITGSRGDDVRLIAAAYSDVTVIAAEFSIHRIA